MKACAICNQTACVCGCNMYEEPDSVKSKGKDWECKFLVIFLVGVLCGTFLAAAVMAK